MVLISIKKYNEIKELAELYASKETERLKRVNMQRTNVTTWRDCETITRKCHELVEELMKYQKTSMSSTKSILEDDLNVMVRAIELRDRLITLIDRSPH